MDTLSTELFDEISKIPCINSHSHISPEIDRIAEAPDALAFFKHAYPASDLVSAGMSPDQMKAALEPGLPLADRWQIFEPYFRFTRLTGYSQCIIEGFRDLLGFPDLTAETVEPISDALREHSKPGFYHEVLQRRSNIALTVDQHGRPHRSRSNTIPTTATPEPFQYASLCCPNSSYRKGLRRCHHKPRPTR